MVDLPFDHIGVENQAAVSEALAGLDYLIFQNPVQIINVSWDCPENAFMEDRLALAQNENILVVAAGKGLAEGHLCFPASVATVMAVAASEDDGPFPTAAPDDEGLDLMAPSGWAVPADQGQEKNIVTSTSIYPNPQTGIYYEADPENEQEATSCMTYGHSFAVPQAVGVAALLLSRQQDPNDGAPLTVDDIFEILCVTSTRSVAEGGPAYDLVANHPYGKFNSIMGYGELDAGNAVSYGMRQYREIPAGWRWISSRMQPFNTADNGLNDKHGIFLTCKELTDVNHLTQLKDYAGHYWSPANNNFCNIPSWDYKQGYLINLSATTTLVWLGEETAPGEHIPCPAGWSMVSYYPNAAMDEHDGFGSLTDDPAPVNLIMAKDESGHFYSPPFNFSNMGDLTPGYGYQVNLTDAEELEYPVPRATPRPPAPGEPKKLAADPTHFIPAASTDFFFPVLITDVSLDNVEVAEGDEIGVSNRSGLCIGSSATTGDFPMGIAVWRDDTLTAAIDGYLTGEIFFFRYWSSHLNQEFGLDSLNVFGNADASRNDIAVTSLGFSKAAESLPTAFGISACFPNPFNSSTTVRIALPDPGNVKISIFDEQGRSVKEAQFMHRQAGTLNWVWAGRSDEGSMLPSGVYLCSVEFRTAAGREHEAVSKLTMVR